MEHSHPSPTAPGPEQALPGLPAGYEVVRVLSRRPGTLVLRVTWAGQPAVTRLEVGADEGASELAVLAATRHPGLARLIDHGVLDDGSRYVTRGWIEGRTLAEWAAGREPCEHEQLGVLVIRIAEALAALHEAGFVHGDLKPDNVLIGTDGAPVLADYGFATRFDSKQAAGAAGGPAGSLGFIAPELLLGLAPEPRSDLFSLGVLLHELLTGARLRADEFYGRFPGVEFFTAAGSSVSALPDWARELVAALVSRRPSERPASAREVARALAQRLGIERDSTGANSALEWPVTRGREAWMTDLRRSLADGPVALWATTCDAEEARALGRCLLLEASLAGEPLRELRLASAPAEQSPIAALAAGPVLVVSGERDARIDKSIDWVAAELERDGRAFCVIAPGAPSRKNAYAERRLPALTAQVLEPWLAGSFEEQGKRLAQLSASLAEACGGSSSRLSRLLVALQATGRIVAGDKRPRFRPGPIPSSEELALALDEQADLTERDLAELTAALLVTRAAATLDELARTLQQPEPDVAEQLLRAVRLGLVERVEGGAWKLSVRGARCAGGTPEQVLARMHRVRAAETDGLSAQLHAQAASALVGEDPDSEAYAEALRRCREGGQPEIVLAETDALGRFVAGPLARELVAERAHAWLALGFEAETLEEADDLEQRGGDTNVAAACWIRAAACAQRNEHGPALELLERAEQLDPGLLPCVTTARLGSLFARGRHADVVGLVEQLERDAGDAPERTVAFWCSIRAMSRLRLGATGEARQELEQLALAAREAGDAGREAALGIDLATVARAEGRRDDALLLLEHAERLGEQVGNLPLVAHARSLLAAILREQGRLTEAQARIDAALLARARLGDREGGLVLRGVLALLLAERGHLKRAEVEFRAVLGGLVGERRQAHAPLLEARLFEARARMGIMTAEDAPSRNLGADPRAWLARARGLWVLGRQERAAGDMSAARTQAKHAGNVGLEAEARFLERWLELWPGPVFDESPFGLTLLSTEDNRIAALLAPTAEFDPSEARALADELLEHGRDDRAARLLFALSNRGGGEELAREAEDALGRCTVGMLESERDTLRRFLLGVPDPAPEDLRHRDRDPGDEDLARVLEINRLLVQQEGLPDLTRVIVDCAMAETGAERGFLVLEEDGELRFDTALSSMRGKLDSPELEISRTIVQRALEAGHVLRLSNAVDDPELGQAASVAPLELRSVLCVPVDVDGRTRAAIYVDNRVKPGAFGERAERLLGLLADQASLAIRQVSRLHEIKDLNQQLRVKVVEQQSDLDTARAALAEASLGDSLGGLVGDSSALRDVRNQITRAARADIPVLLAGESGTGKDLAARALHAQSPWSEGPFVVEDCAAVALSLVEAELFGHVKGAFTGAERDVPGVFERADGGSIFLDEVGELEPAIQAKLLRVLETGEVRRLGGTEPVRVRFRLIAASNRNLHDEVEAGRFRQDLFYRLNGVQITMPSLSDRPADVPLLVKHFLRLEAARSGSEPSISNGVLRALCTRAWPGNVRELRNEIARLCVLSPGHIDDATLVSAPLVAQRNAPLRALDEIEREAVLATLEATGGNKLRTAKILGISRGTLYERLRRYESS